MPLTARLMEQRTDGGVGAIIFRGAERLKSHPADVRPVYWHPADVRPVPTQKGGPFGPPFARLVPMAGLEPAQLSLLPPQDSVSTNSTTSANFESLDLLPLLGLCVRLFDQCRLWQPIARFRRSALLRCIQHQLRQCVLGNRELRFLHLFQRRRRLQQAIR